MSSIDFDDDGAAGGMSRRTMIGVAAGAAWAAPSVTYVASAGAGSPGPGEICGCAAENPTCQGPTQECPDAPVLDFDCFCWMRVDGSTFCGSFAYTSTCESDDECDPGYVCVVCDADSCACGATGRACAPPCDNCADPNPVPAVKARVAANPSMH